MPNLTPSKLNNSRHALQSQLGQYVYFSPLTTGTNGRAVKINKELFLPFFCCVDPSTHDGQLIIRQIEKLRAAPAHSFSSGRKDSSQHITRLSKINSGFEHLLIVKNLHIYYRISQEKSDGSPAIYITNIRELSSGSSNQTGLYQQIHKTRGRSIEAVKSSKLDGKKVYISGLSSRIATAMEEAKYATGSEEALLFYSHTNAINDLGVWNSSRLSHAAKETVEKLADLLKLNHAPYHGIDWFVSGEGASVLEKALANFSGSLKGHSFKLHNSIGKSGALINALSDKKAELKGEFFQYERNLRALTSIALNREQILSSINKLPNRKNYDVITQRYLCEQINGVANIGEKITKSGQSVSQSTFLQCLQSAGKYR